MTADSVSAWVALGSNLDGPANHIRKAVDDLCALQNTSLIACSSLYANSPMGPPDQPDYINAIVRLQTTLTPLALLAALQSVERRHGRVRERERRWGARTLDLDIILYSDRVIEHPRLTVPHPGVAERAFVLRPLAELAVGLNVPGYGPVDTLLGRVDDAALQRLT